MDGPTAQPVEGTPNEVLESDDLALPDPPAPFPLDALAETSETLEVTATPVTADPVTSESTALPADEEPPAPEPSELDEEVRSILPVAVEEPAF